MNSLKKSYFLKYSNKTINISQDETVNIDVKFQCAATLIDRETLITAAHCIVKSFEYEIQNEYYMIDVETNKYYPTLESMYKIYLGIHNQSETFSVDPYTVRKIFVVRNIY